MYLVLKLEFVLELIKPAWASIALIQRAGYFAFCLLLRRLCRNAIEAIRTFRQMKVFG